MKKTFEINGRKVEFTECTAICSDYPEEGRRNCIKIHDVSDEFCDGDGVIFNCDLPEDAEDADTLLINEYLDTDHETLDTVEIL